MNSVFVIAEAGVNHNGDVAIAMRLVDAAIEAGADCVKFQIHILKNEMLKQTPQSDNFKETLWEALERTNFTIEEHLKLKKICEKNKIQHVEIPQLHSPRASFTVYLYTMLKVLKKTIPIDNNDIYESIQKLQLIRKKICSSNLTESNTALNLAEWIIGIPLIYYPYGLQACATRFKNSLQENAKMHALAEDVLEASHNGIVSWERKSKVQPIILRGKDDYIKTKERWQIFKEYFKKNDIEYQEIMSVNGSILSKLITLIYLLDYCSIYKAALSNIDPTPILSIDYIKKRL